MEPIPEVTFPVGGWRNSPDRSTAVTAESLNRRDDILNRVVQVLNAGQIPADIAADLLDPESVLGSALTDKIMQASSVPTTATEGQALIWRQALDRWVAESLPPAVPMVDFRVPANNLPQVFRATDTQPFAADSIWNTPIGGDAQFESATDAATSSFLTATPAVNDTLNGYGFYLNIARPTDPLGVGSYTSSGGNPVTFTHRMPYDPVISSGSDGSMRIIDGRYAYDYWKTTKVDDVHYTAQFITRTDLLGTGRNAGTRAARWPTSGGLIRSHEMAKCYIPHALCVSIPAASLKRGFVWPASAEDAATLVYSGEVPMGSFFALPPSVNISTLSLSQEGYALAECLQNYGAYVGDQSSTAAISVDGEAAVVMRPALERIRAAWMQIFPLLRRVSNVGTTAGAPGPRRVPASGPVSIRTDYQETVIDVLTSRLRVTSGAMITSEDAKISASPMVSTSAGLGGRSIAWSGWPSQYRLDTQAIKRVAEPDGQTRIVLVDPGVRNTRVEATLVARQASGWAYLVVASVSSSESYRLAWTSMGAMQIQKVTPTGGTVALAGTGLPNGTAAAGRRIGLMAYGPTLYALVDGEVVAEAVDTDVQIGRLCGLYFPSDTSIAVSDFTVRSVPRLFRKPRVDAT